MFFFLLFSLGVFIFLFYNVHYFIMLLSLEMILLSLVFFLLLGLAGGFDLVASFFFLLLMACMGGYSISLLVSLFRGVGKDFWISSHFF